MGDGSPTAPRRGRVPGATGSSPAQSTWRVLPDALMARIQAGVDSAHAVRDRARGDAKGNDAEPLPRQRTADRRGDAGRRLDAEALDDLAESYLAADPDLTAGYIEGATADDAISDESTGSGGDVLGSAERPGQRTAGRRHGPVPVPAASAAVGALLAH